MLSAACKRVREAGLDNNVSTNGMSSNKKRTLDHSCAAIMLNNNSSLNLSSKCRAKNSESKEKTSSDSDKAANHSNRQFFDTLKKHLPKLLLNHQKTAIMAHLEEKLLVLLEDLIDLYHPAEELI